MDSQQNKSNKVDIEWKGTQDALNPRKDNTNREHVVALPVILAVLALVVELPEEVEGEHGVHVHHDARQQHSQHQLKRNHQFR